MNRRQMISTGAAAALAPPAFAATPPDDPYGLRAIAGQPAPNGDDGPIADFERTLRLFGEPSILRAGDIVARPVFRLTSLRYNIPDCARIEWDPVTLHPSITTWTTGWAEDGRRNVPSGGKLTLPTEDGVELRALVDDRERFWDAAPRPPDWAQIDGQQWLNHYSFLLEGRVGAKRHAILRDSAPDGSLIADLAKKVLPRRENLGPR